MEAVRFFAVAAAGFVLDIGVAWSVERFLGLPIWIAAAIGFAFAALMNYVLHELWTFRNGVRHLSSGRASRYVVGLLLTLATRVVAVYVLDALLNGGYPLAVLIGGAGASFCINYLLSRYWVFRRSAELKEIQLS